VSQSILKFPGQELERSFRTIQSLLNATKPLAERLVLDKTVKEAFVKCIGTVQSLLCEEQDWAESCQQQEDESMEDLDEWQQYGSPQHNQDMKKFLERMWQNGEITWEQLQEKLNTLENESNGIA